METKKDIFKIQIDFTGRKVLAYNSDKSVISEFPAGKDIKKLMGKKCKKYFVCVVHNGILNILGETEPQAW